MAEEKDEAAKLQETISKLKDKTTSVKESEKYSGTILKKMDIVGVNTSIYIALDDGESLLRVVFGGQADGTGNDGDPINVTIKGTVPEAQTQMLAKAELTK